MNRTRRRLAAVSLSLALLLLSGTPALAALRGGGRAPGLDNPALRAGGQDYLPGVVIVKFVNRLPADGAGKATGSAELDGLVTAHAVNRIERFAPNIQGPRKPGGTDLSRIYLLHFGSGKDAKQVARDFAASWEVEYAEPQFVYPLAATPNDPQYSSQASYYNRMSFPTAFDDTKGESGNVVVAIVDGGTEWGHEDLTANVWSNTDEVLDGTDTDGNGHIDDVRGWNFANETNDPTGLPQTPNSAGHGTHVAGIACAVTNNATGVAGASWNATYMPICTASPSQDNAIAFGYQGILYAIENGADVINCSWGGLGNPSNFEQEVINMAHDSGIAVVAAAGNNGTSQDHFPSAYDHVLSVANVSGSDIKVGSSNFGVTVDVSAQGVLIRSTYRNNGYANLIGTSMSSPHAAAACALVKTKFPASTADQVMERVRVTSDNIDGLNPAYAGQLGFGRINAAQALTMTTPAITVVDAVISTTDGDLIIEPGETVTLDLTVINHLDPATTVDFTLGENSGFATVTNGSASLASIATLQSVQLPSMTVDISGSAPVNHVITFTLAITAASPSYADADRFELTVLPIAATHGANNVVTSVTSVGKLGFGEVAGGNGKDGVGFMFAGSTNLLFEGALMIGTGVTTISDAARGADGSTQDDDFVTATNGIPIITAPLPPFAEYGVASFTDAAAASSLNLFVRQESWEMASAPNDDYITIQYTIRNDGGATLNGLYAGWYFDWDIDGATFSTNSTSYDAGRGLGYVWDSGTGPDAYIGIMTLSSPGTTSYRGIWNDQDHPSNPSWGVYDGYTDSEKWESLSGGIAFTDAGPADVSNTIATGPFDIAPGDSVIVAFAILGGNSLADLQANADAAQNLWDNPPTDAGDHVVVPRRLLLSQNVPNPFNPNTTIAFELPRASRVGLRVYGVDGRLVRRLEDGTRERGIHRVTWDGIDDAGNASPSGTYFYVLTVDGHSMTRKMQLVK
ncbi:MAG: S8 family serine peptidase [Candidatus Krumholzibacteriia bacterium]